MKRSALFIATVVFTVVGLLAAGCGEKPKDSTQPPAPTTQKVNMQEGQWEVTVMNEMPGMPAGMMTPVTFTTCLSQKELIAKPQDQPPDCKMQDVKIAGNTVTWGVVCPEMSSKGTITYVGTSYDGVTETTMKVEGREMKMKTTMKGKYLGACPTPAQK